MAAEKPKSVNKEDLIEASREFRKGAQLSMEVAQEFMQDGFLDEPGEEEREFTKEQIAKLKQSRKHLEKSAALNPYFPEVYIYIANSYWEIENDLKKTVEYYNKALELDPDYAEVISARGHVYVLLKQEDKAKADLKKLEQLESEFADGLREDIAEMVKKVQ